MSEYENMPVEQIDSEIANLEGQLAARGVDVPKETKPEKPAVEKPGLFEHGSDAKLTKSMERVYDKAEAKDDFLLGAKDVPSAKADSFDDSFEKTFDWIEKSEPERTTLRDARGLLDTVRENARKFGVELSDEQAMNKAMELEQQQAAEAKAQQADPWQSAAAEIQKYYPTAKAPEIAAEYAKLEGRFRQDPVAGFSEMANGIGVHPVQLAQAVIARHQHPQYQHYQQQQQQQDYQQAVAALTNLVEQQYAANPRMAELAEDVVAELASAKRSGDPAADLRRAVQKAEQKNRKRSTSDRIDRSMNATFDRVIKR